MSKRILIIRSNENGFERFVTSRIKAKGYEVVEPYSIPIKKMNKIQLLRFRSRVPVLYKNLIGSWKDRIDDYDTVIIFDNALTIQLAKYIAAYNKQCDIKIWLWNRRNIDRNLFLKYCSIYTFDEDFAVENGYVFIPQFYFDDVIIKTNSNKSRVYYIGYDKDRYVALKRISRLFNHNGIEFKFILRKVANKEYCDENQIILVDKDIEYEDVLADISNSSCLLELNEKKQTGLTLRSLEALFGRKKLITNNKNIKNFDFYNSSNVFILGEDNEKSLVDFIGGTYIVPPDTVMEKHTFDYWFKQITGEK